MRKLFRVTVECVLAFFLMARIGGDANATETVALSLAETVRQAHTIVLGTVTAKQSRWGDASQRWMVTDYSFAVESVLYTSPNGRGLGNNLVLSYWGGTLDGETQTISDMRLPEVGERLVVMLRSGWQEGGFSPVVGFNQGLFSVSPDVPGGPALIRSDTGADHSWRPNFHQRR